MLMSTNNTWRDYKITLPLLLYVASNHNECGSIYFINNIKVGILLPWRVVNQHVTKKKKISPVVQATVLIYKGLGVLLK